MERLNKDLLSLILARISSDEDRKSCSQVSKLWYATEPETRSRVRIRVSILQQQNIPQLLSRFPSLTDLTLHHSVITDQTLSLIAAACPNLRSLDLSKSKTRFTDAGIIAVYRCLHLSVLNLSPSAPITDVSLAALAHLPSLTELYLRDCMLFTDVGLSFFATGHASRSLKVLCLQQCCGITDVGVSSSLPRMTCLEELNLSKCCQLTDVSGVALGRIATLRKLDLSWQDAISDTTLNALANGCRNLEKICLQCCKGVTGRGLLSLASSLPLESLDISWIYVNSDFRSCDVLKIAKRCPSLKRMYVNSDLEEGLTQLQKKRLNKLCSGLCGMVLSLHVCRKYISP